MARSKQQQSKHDAKVLQVAEGLSRMGYKVEADLAGFSRPDTINGFRPDVVARKGWDRIIVEVETRDSLNTARDQAQQRAFKAAADRAKRTTFQRKVAE